MKKYNTEAIILKNIKYKDADKIFTMFTKDEGKISAIARGVRKISSRRGGNLDTLNLVKVKIHESSKGFKNIEEVKTLQSFKDLKKDLETSKRAYFIVELVHRSIEEGEKDEKIFDLLVKSLSLLSKKKYHADVVVAYFEINLLKELGYQLNLEKCVKCGKVLDMSWFQYVFNFDLGGFACGSCSNVGFKVSKETVGAILDAYKGKLDLIERSYIDEVSALMKRYIDLKLECKFKSLEI